MLKLKGKEVERLIGSEMMTGLLNDFLKWNHGLDVLLILAIVSIVGAVIFAAIGSYVFLLLSIQGLTVCYVFSSLYYEYKIQQLKKEKDSHE